MGFASTADDPAIKVSGAYYDGFELGDVFHAPSGTDIHFSAYVPGSYDGTRPYALFVTLSGYEGLYFQGVGANLQWERFGQESIAYNAEMIVLAPQLDDWGQGSASQTIELVEHFVTAYNIDATQVYLEGYSGGGETLSLVLETRPELFAAALAVSSQWDGRLDALVRAKTPIRLFTGRDDSYYGSESFASTAEELRRLYAEAGASEAEIEELVVLDIKEAAYFTERGYRDQHGGGGAAAHDEQAMGWLFSHQRQG